MRIVVGVLKLLTLPLRIMVHLLLPKRVRRGLRQIRRIRRIGRLLR